MQKNTIKILLTLLFISPVIASDFYYNISPEQLPFNKDEPTTIRYFENRTLNISIIGNFTSTNQTYLYFNDTMNESDFNVHIYIPNTIQTGNYTDYVQLNDYEYNFTSNISFLFEINNTIDNITNITNMTNNTYTAQNFTPYIQNDINEYTYVICDYSQPTNISKDITLVGFPGQTLYLTFNSTVFPQLPATIVVPTTNVTNQTIFAHISNLAIGMHTFFIRFSYSDTQTTFNNMSFHFDVRDCVKPPPQYNSMVEVCAIVDSGNATTQQVLECQRLRAEYQQELYKSMLETQEERTIVNETVVYVNRTQRVPVLDLDDQEIVQTLKDIPVTWKQMQTDYNQKALKIDELQQQVQDLSFSYNEDLNKTVQEIAAQTNEKLRVLVNDNTILHNTVDEYEKTTIKKSSIYWWIAILVFVGLGVGGYILYDINNLW